MAEQRPQRLYEFGPFRLIPEESLLLRDGHAIALSPKDFEVLAALVGRSGRLVGKEELLKEVWPDSFVEEANLSRHVYALRRALGEDADGQPYIETVPKRGYRFMANVREVTNGDDNVTVQPVGTVETVTRTRIVAEEEISVEGQDSPRVLRDATLALPASSIRRDTRLKRAVLFGTLAALALGIAAASYFYLRRPQPLTNKDVILLADFENKTGDDVFDGTLKQALAVQLEQSPFLSIFSDERVRETLRYMGRSPDEPITKQVARELCQRQGIKALLTGTIVNLGSHYVITLEAMNVETGDVIGRAQVDAAGKEQVLRVLGVAALGLREKLGESLPSIQKFDAPVEQATTSSLEALKAFSLAREQHARGRYLEAIPFYRRAIELDPNFALAYSNLSTVYANTRQFALSVEYAQKAFALRERVSEREKLHIAANYYGLVTREADRAIEAYDLFTKTYPRDALAYAGLVNQYVIFGQYEKVIAPSREALRLNPTLASPYSNLAAAFMGLNRFDEAKETLDQALAHKADTLSAHRIFYSLAFINGDGAGMQQHIEWAKGRPDEYFTLEWQSDVADFAGQRRKSNELYQRAIEMAQQRGLKESASTWSARDSLKNALIGDCGRVKNEIQRTLAIVRSRNALHTAAEALTMCGEIDVAQPLMEEVERQYPKDTPMNQVRLPAIRALAEIKRGNSAQAIQMLQAAKPYELAQSFNYSSIYARGLAYLRAGDGAQAMAEFQRILDHRGVDVLSIRHPLARLGLARGAALAGDSVRSRKAYEDFFALWKDADPDIPILRDAKREYASLR